MTLFIPNTTKKAKETTEPKQFKNSVSIFVSTSPHHSQLTSGSETNIGSLNYWEVKASARTSSKTTLIGL